MDILFFTQYFPPEIGAAPVRAYYHAKKWVELGHRVRVVTNVPNSPFGETYKGYKNKFVQKETIDGIEVIRLLTLASGKEASIFKRFMGSLVYLKMSLGTLFLKRPDIVLGSAPFFAGFAAYLHAKLKRTPVIYELRDPWLPVVNNARKKFQFPLKLLFKLEKHILNKSDRVVVIGRQMSHYVKDKYVLDEEPDIIYNGIVPEYISNNGGYIPSSLTSLMDNKLKIAFIGNLGNQYDLDVILETALSLQKQGKAHLVRFFVVGEGAQKNYFEQRVNQLNLEQIHLHEAIPYKDSLALLGKMDLSLIPLKQGKMYDLYLPVRMFESLAKGVPPLLCNAGEAGDIIRNSQSGANFDSNNPAQLVEIINDYIENPGKLTSQGNRGRDFVLRHFNRATMADKYLQLFEKVL